MSPLDTLKSQIESVLGLSKDEAATASSPDFLSGFAEMLQKLGLSSLVEKFKEHGLSDVIHSWIGKGENLPISAEKLHQILGPDTIEALAQKVGLPPGKATELLAKILPGLVDKMTPNGVIEDVPTSF
jgi:uncharacterized protein YidB (DUF937 family)